MTSLQSVYIADPNAVAEVAPAKQATAMPPNFIHSLDATHMLMTAMQCQQDDITFASVHDSYWSHASSIDKLSENIREMFIELHSRDIIGDLHSEVGHAERRSRAYANIVVVVLREVQGPCVALPTRPTDP
jgi:DNA-directed RNA polymerase